MAQSDGGERRTREREVNRKHGHFARYRIAERDFPDVGVIRASEHLRGARATARSSGRVTMDGSGGVAATATGNKRAHFDGPFLQMDDQQRGSRAVSSKGFWRAGAGRKHELDRRAQEGRQALTGADCLHPITRSLRAREQCVKPTGRQLLQKAAGEEGHAQDAQEGEGRAGGGERTSG
jgi:hypothetical protein